MLATSRARPTRALVALVACATLLLGAAACSDDGGDEESSPTTVAASTEETDTTDGGDATTATTGVITATGTDAEWCEGIIAWSEGGDDVDLNDDAAYIAYVQELQTLAEDAPEPIAEDMSTVAQATQDLVDGGPTASVDPAVQAETEAAAGRAAAWVLDNCGYDLNG